MSNEHNHICEFKNLYISKSNLYPYTQIQINKDCNSLILTISEMEHGCSIQLSKEEVERLIVVLDHNYRVIQK